MMATKIYENNNVSQSRRGRQWLDESRTMGDKLNLEYMDESYPGMCAT